jgi:acetyltransferase
MAEQKWIKEMDVNPLSASSKGFVALDARAVLFGPGGREEDLPVPAIRPYPSKYAGTFRMKGGDAVLIRPIRPEDEFLLVRFHRSLSERSVRLRYLGAMKLESRVAHERLSRACFTDYDRDLALVAERRDGPRRREVVAVGRLSRSRLGASAEVSFLVADPWQRKGLGRELMRRLLRAAREEGVRSVTARMLAENVDMRVLCEENGFRAEREAGTGIIVARLDLETERDEEGAP